MKKNFFVLTTLVMCVISANFYAQNAPPELISYQGIARDASGQPLSNQTIGIKFILHQGNVTGTPIFKETHAVLTNSLGLFTVEIGKNDSLSFQSINWANGPYYLEVQMDPTGDTSYVSIGTQQLLSVPYALYSKRAKTVDSIPNRGTHTAWSTEGNYQTDSTINFIGTKDNFPLIFKTANTERMRIGKNGKVRIGNSTLPTHALLSVFGKNMGLYVRADSGTIILDGYSNWAIYSDKGNIMIKDGHIKSKASNTPTVSTLSTSPVTASLVPGSTDVKGTVEVLNITPSLNPHVISLQFAQVYSNTPVVVVSVIDNGNDEAKNISYYISSVSPSGFTIKINNNNPPNTAPLNNLKFTYIVIE